MVNLGKGYIKTQILWKEYPKNLLLALDNNKDIFPENINMVNRAISSCLNEREQKLISLRYINRNTLKVIGVILGVCPERVRQIEVVALRKLRRELHIEISELNKASIIILEAEKFLKIKIDKVDNKITEMFYAGINTNRDVTKEILDVDSNYLIGNIGLETPYTLGMVIARIFHGDVNRKCIKILNTFDRIILKS